jgi:hypothetical protein
MQDRLDFFNNKLSGSDEYDKLKKLREMSAAAAEAEDADTARWEYDELLMHEEMNTLLAKTAAREESNFRRDEKLKHRILDLKRDFNYPHRHAPADDVPDGSQANPQGAPTDRARYVIVNFCIFIELL